LPALARSARSTHTPTDSAFVNKSVPRIRLLRLHCMDTVEGHTCHSANYLQKLPAYSSAWADTLTSRFAHDAETIVNSVAVCRCFKFVCTLVLVLLVSVTCSGSELLHVFVVHSRWRAPAAPTATRHVPLVATACDMYAATRHAPLAATGYSTPAQRHRACKFQLSYLLSCYATSDSALAKPFMVRHAELAG
jgi:hypothetical protein